MSLPLICKGENHQGSRILPASPEHFQRNSNRRTGFDPICKACKGTTARSKSEYPKESKEYGRKALDSIRTGIEGVMDTQELAITVLDQLVDRKRNGHLVSRAIDFVLAEGGKMLNGLLPAISKRLAETLDHIKTNREGYEALFGPE